MSGDGSRHPRRREFLALGVGALAVATLPRALRRPERLIRRQVPIMGTIADVAVRHRDERWAYRAIDAAISELRRVEAAMTRFRADSDVGRANQRAGLGAVAVSEDTAEVLTTALTWAAGTDGRFDPCLGRVSALWDFGSRTRPPTAQEVGPFTGRAMYRTLEIERHGPRPTVTLHDPAAALDLGGIAKGFGVDAAARALGEQGVFHALVNVGGDLVALGVAGDGEPWRIGVRSPERPDEVIHTLHVSNRAVATSGDYLQYFQHGGHRYHHLLDPTSGAPRESSMRSLTVEAERCMTADAAATALFGSSRESSVRVLERVAPDAMIVHSV
jgi:thiamine biosynthesis lipoprotein